LLVKFIDFLCRSIPASRNRILTWYRDSELTILNKSVNNRKIDQSKLNSPATSQWHINYVSRDWLVIAQKFYCSDDNWQSEKLKHVSERLCQNRLVISVSILRLG
jgi:hypothetical protein